MDDDIRWVKFSRASWSKQGDGFYYSRYAEPVKGQELKEQNLNQKLYFHRVGEPQSKDRLVYERPDQPKWGLHGGETEDGKYLVIHVSLGTKDENALFYRDLPAGPDAPVVELLSKFDADYTMAGNEGGLFFFQTTNAAPNRRVISVDLKNPSPENWKTIIPESKNPITGTHRLAGQWIIERMTDAHDEVTVYDSEGKEKARIPLPNFGSAGGFGGLQTDEETFYSVSGFDTPGTIYRYDTRSGKSTVHQDTKMAFDASSVEPRCPM